MWEEAFFNIYFILKLSLVDSKHDRWWYYVLKYGTQALQVFFESHCSVLNKYGIV